MVVVGFKPDLWRPSGFLQCFDTVGLVIWPVKIVPEMTYYVSSGTLNPTHLHPTILNLLTLTIPLLLYESRCLHAVRIQGSVFHINGPLSSVFPNLTTSLTWFLLLSLKNESIFRELPSCFNFEAFQFENVWQRCSNYRIAITVSTNN